MAAAAAAAHSSSEMPIAWYTYQLALARTRLGMRGRTCGCLRGRPNDALREEAVELWYASMGTLREKLVQEAKEKADLVWVEGRAHGQFLAAEAESAKLLREAAAGEAPLTAEERTTRALTDFPRAAHILAKLLAAWIARKQEERASGHTCGPPLLRATTALPSDPVEQKLLEYFAEEDARFRQATRACCRTVGRGCVSALVKPLQVALLFVLSAAALVWIIGF